MKTLLKSIVFSLLVYLIIINNSGCTKDYADIQAPSEVSDLKIIPSAAKAALTWSDPSNFDLRLVEISYGQSTILVEKGVQSKEITGLEYGKDYLFTVKTIDKSGNKSSGLQISTNLDYRLKYTGDYIFFSFNTFSSMGQYTTYDTILFNGYISIPDHTDSSIYILYRPGTQTYICGADSIFGAHIQVSINSEDSVIHWPDCTFTWANTFKFIPTDSVEIGLLAGGLGAHFGQVIRGKRIK